MAQPPRFAARSQILRDLKQEHGAARLYLLLDDIAGQSGEAWPTQAALADYLGVSIRHIQRWLDGLVKAHYVAIDRGRKRLKYVLKYTTPVSCSDYDTRHPCPPYATPMSPIAPPYLITELRQESEIASGDVLYSCQKCRDTGKSVLSGQECRACDTYIYARRRKQERWKRA